MNITILDNRDVIINSSDNLGTQNENNASIINFSFPESLMNANKKIVFITDDGNYWDLITNNSYKITNAVSKYKNVSVYVWLVDEQNDIDFRSKIWNVSFNKNEEPDDIVPTEEEISGFDTMITQLNQGLEELDEEKIKLRREYAKVEEGLENLNAALTEVDNIDIDASKSGNTSTITITNKEGVEKSVQIEDGTDYVITQEDYQAIANVVETDITPLMPTKTSDLDNDSGFIDNTVNNLTNYYDKTTSDGKYALITETGYRVELSVDNSTYVMTLNLKNKSGNILNTQTVDLPLETMVVNARYDSFTKEIVLTLQNGNTVRFSVADLVSGLQAEITSSNKLASDLVDDTNQTNKFVTTSEKTTWNAKYVKPSGGIPKTDLSSAVQTSLGKADTAIQATDLTDYVKNTDYATSQKGGTVRIAGAYGFSIDGGGYINPIYLNNYTDYSSKNNNYAISKGTLETVITGKKLETANNKVTSIDENSTDDEYPSAKCVYDSQEELFDVYNYSFVKNASDNIFTTTENDTVQDKMFSIATGELSGNTYQNYLAFINYIEIKSNKNYYFALYNPNNTFNTLIGCIVCFYDKNKNFISGLQTSNTNQPIISPANAKYLRISISKTYYTDFKFLVSENSYPQTYAEYFEKYYTLNKKLLINYNDIVVDINESGDFTTIQEAFEYIESKKDNNYHNRYNVYIKEGNYDLGANFSNEDLNNSNVSGVTVPDYTYLIGLGNKKNIVLYCTFNDKQQYISTLNLKGSCGLKNITVMGTKTRYAIHVDTVQSSEYHQLIKNCIIKGIDTYYSVVYGTGTYDNAYWEFSDTIFDGTETGNNGGSGIPFTVHNSLNAFANRFIKFTNCRFKTNSINKNAILFKTLAYRPNNLSESANNMVTYVEIYGCKFGGNGFSLVEENPTYYGTGCLYYITGYGNNNASYEIVTTDGIDYSDRVDII